MNQDAPRGMMRALVVALILLQGTLGTGDESTPVDPLLEVAGDAGDLIANATLGILEKVEDIADHVLTPKARTADTTGSAFIRIIDAPNGLYREEFFWDDGEAFNFWWYHEDHDAWRIEVACRPEGKYLNYGWHAVLRSGECDAWGKIPASIQQQIRDGGTGTLGTVGFFTGQWGEPWNATLVAEDFDLNVRFTATEDGVVLSHTGDFRGATHLSIRWHQDGVQTTTIPFEAGTHDGFTLERVGDDYVLRHEGLFLSGKVFVRV